MQLRVRYWLTPGPTFLYVITLVIYLTAWALHVAIGLACTAWGLESCRYEASTPSRAYYGVGVLSFVLAGVVFYILLKSKSYIFLAINAFAVSMGALNVMMMGEEWMEGWVWTMTGVLASSTIVFIFMYAILPCHLSVVEHTFIEAMWSPAAIALVVSIFLFDALPSYLDIPSFDLSSICLPIDSPLISSFCPSPKPSFLSAASISSPTSLPPSICFPSSYFPSNSPLLPPRASLRTTGISFLGVFMSVFIPSVMQLQDYVSRFYSFLENSPPDARRSHRNQVYRHFYPIKP